MEDPRFVLFNASSASVSETYATIIILAIAFSIAAIGSLFYYSLLNISSRRQDSRQEEIVERLQRPLR